MLLSIFVNVTGVGGKSRMQPIQIRGGEGRGGEGGGGVKCYTILLFIVSK